MATDMKRLTLSLTPEIENGLDKLKRERFYNRPYAEMLRTIISMGLTASITNDIVETTTSGEVNMQEGRYKNEII